MLKDILANRFTARWWEKQPVEPNALEAILDCAYLAPSKNGKHEFLIYVVTNSPAGKELKRWLYQEDTYCLNMVRAAPGPGPKRFNGQVIAPIVLIWVAKAYHTRLDVFGEDGNVRNDRDCIVSSTMAMCQAEELGLQTGFCGCLGPTEVATKLGLEGYRAVVAMGIGQAIPDQRIIRSVTRNGTPVGFDLSNTDPSIRFTDNRKNRPPKDSMINYI